MTFTFRGAVLVLVCFMSLPFALANDDGPASPAKPKGRPQPAGPESDEAAVRALVGELTGLFSSKTPTPLSNVQRLLGEDFSRVNSLGVVTEGKEAFLAQYRKEVALLKQRFEEYHQTWEARSVRIFGDAAVVLAKFEMTGVLRKGSRRVAVPFWGTLVLRKDDGQWQFVHVGFVRAEQRARSGASSS